MPWRWTNPDARPVTEYLYDYHMFRRSHRFLYYCRECIRNFDTAERVEACPRCGQTAVIELPKETKLERRRGAKPYNLGSFKKDILKAWKELAPILARLRAQLRLGLWRAKIAAYYFLTPMPEELK